MNHPAIIDNTTPSVEFLEWVNSQGYRVTLEIDGPHIKATLVGTHYVLSDYLCGTWSNSFTGYGADREEAIAALAKSCCGRDHFPQITKGWFSTSYGSAQRMPRFA